MLLVNMYLFIARIKLMPDMESTSNVILTYLLP